MFSRIRELSIAIIRGLNIAYFLLLSIACSKNLDTTAEAVTDSGNNTNSGNRVSQHYDQDLNLREFL